MLVLDSKPGRSIFIGGRAIQVVYLGLTAYGEARIGIDAPKGMTIYRDKVQDRIDIENGVCPGQNEQCSQCGICGCKVRG